MGTSKIDTALEEIALHLSSLAADAGTAERIEQALVDLVGTLEKLKPTDAGAIVDAIKGLKLNVTVNPQFNLPDKPFKPLKLRVIREKYSDLIDYVELVEK